jgi:dienelactone hydrolase
MMWPLRRLALSLLLLGPAWLGPAGAQDESSRGLKPNGWIDDPLAARHLEQAYRFRHDPAALEVSWERAIVFVPGEEMGHFTYGFLGSQTVRDRLAALPAGRRYPLVIYLHDADGLTVIENSLMEEFEIENIAALFPDSLTARRRVSDCTGEGCAMSPEVYLARRSEMIHAVSRARRLAWVDPDNIFLVGLGEGGAVVALWGADIAVNAYAVASWTCTAPPEAPWFQGLRTPLERPVLLLNSHATRWTGRPGWDGLCAERPGQYQRAASVVIDTVVENVFALAAGRRALIAFLHEHRVR